MTSVKFSTAWKKSKQPRKKHKFMINAPNHIRRKFLGACLSNDLREKYGRRSIEVRKGDEVKIMRGKFSGKTGKVTEIKVKDSKIAVENIQIPKKDGSKVNVWIHPSNVMVLSLGSDDKKRIKSKELSKNEAKPHSKSEAKK